MDRDRFDIRPFCLCIVSTLDKQLTTINVVLNAQFRWFWLKSWRHASRNESMFKTPNGVCVWYDRTHMINPLAIDVVFSLIKYSTIGTTTRQSFRVIFIWKLLTNRKIHITACHLSDRRVYIENETFSLSLLGAASGFRFNFRTSESKASVRSSLSLCTWMYIVKNEEGNEITF